MATILRLTNQHPDFYQLLGPYLSRRHIAKELGEPVWNDDEKDWFIAVDGGQVCGFASVRPVKGHVVFGDSYVLPEWRGQGIGTQLRDARLAAYGDKRIRLIAGRAHAMWDRLGFIERRTTKHYAFLERGATHAQ